MKPDIAELKRLAQKATPGPWAVREDGFAVVSEACWVAGTDRRSARGFGEESSKTTAAYIAAANPQAILALIERLETLEECLKTMFGYMESGFLVRDTTHDSEPGWAFRMVQFTVDLGKCYRAISAPDAAELEKEAAAIKDATK